MDKAFGYMWVPHEEHAWVPARIKSEDGGKLVFETDQGVKLEFQPGEIDKEKLEKVTEEELVGPGLDNLVNLGNFTEGGVLNEIRKRYMKDHIYTSISTILISVNPYQMLPIYHSAVVEEYKSNHNDAPSHVYKIGADAYRRMLDEGDNQAVIISGESGAGKTEATKAILQYLSDVAGSTNNVEQRILQSNPILEAFGNAKTVRNNNSSRFGKWMEIDFQAGGVICAARIINYLLEKSRVVGPGEGERNYHVFYQFLKGVQDDQKAKYKLIAMEEYRYIKCENYDVDKVDDVYEFSLVERAFGKLQFTSEETDGLWTVVASVLNLGNIEFGDKASAGKKGKADGSEVTNKGHLAGVADLMALDSTTLESAFTFKTLSVRGSVSMVPMLPADAQSSCDALAKGLYGSVFDWLIKRINTSLSGETANDPRKIGILDIFGFEIFIENSFEQFCINYCNEKLQQHFTNHIFKLEQAEYKSEGVSIGEISFEDNIECLALIEANDAKKGIQGILAMIDEEVNLPKGSDEQFVQKMHDKFAGKQSKEKSKFYEFSPKKRSYFKIVHYAGAVEYNTVRWLEKNKDTMPDSLKQLINKSGVAMIKMLVEVPADDGAEAKKDTGGEPKSRRAKRGASKGGGTMKKGNAKASLGAQFKNQLKALMDTLTACNPHYVRCIKPNTTKTPQSFNGDLVLRQMRYAGLFEAIRIRQAGYPFRSTFEDFNKRYQICLDKTNKQTYDGKASEKDKAAFLLDQFFSFAKKKDGVAIGNTKVLMRNEQRVALQKLRDQALTRIVMRLQACAKAVNTRKWYAAFNAFHEECKAAVEGIDSDKMKELLKKAESRDFKLAILAKISLKLDFLLEEARVLKILQEAIEEGELTVLEAALDQAKKLLENQKFSGHFKPQDTFTEAHKKAKASRDDILRKDAARKKLAAAVIGEKIEALQVAIQEAKDAGLKEEDYKAAAELLKILEFEAETMEKLRKALDESKSGTETALDGLGEALDAASKITMNEERSKTMTEAKETHLKGWFELLKNQMSKAKADTPNQLPDYKVTIPVKDLPLAPEDAKVQAMVEKLQAMTYTDYSELVKQGNHHLEAQLQARVAGHMKSHLDHINKLMNDAEANNVMPTHETLKPVKSLPLPDIEENIKNNVIPGLLKVGYADYAEQAKTFLDTMLKKRIAAQQKAHIEYMDAQIAACEEEFKRNPPTADMDTVPERLALELRLETEIIPNLAALSYGEACARGGEFLNNFRENVIAQLQTAHFKRLEELIKKCETQASEYLPTKEKPDVPKELPPGEQELTVHLKKLERLLYHTMVRQAKDQLEARKLERENKSKTIKGLIAEAEQKRIAEEKARKEKEAEEARRIAAEEQKKREEEQKAKEEAARIAREEEEARKKAEEEKARKEEEERAKAKKEAEEKAQKELKRLEEEAKKAAQQKAAMPTMDFAIKIDQAQDAQLRAAAEAKDLGKLKDLFADPALKNSQTHDARVARKVLQMLEDQANLLPNLVAAIEEYDVERLRSLIKQAKNNNVEGKEVEEAKNIAFGMSLSEIYKCRLQVFVDRKDLKKVKTILEQAERDGVAGDALEDGQDYVKARDKQIRAETGGISDLPPDQQENKAVHAYKEWQSYAGLFPLKKCKAIRGPAEYAKGKPPELKAKRLVWQSEDIPSTVLKLNAKYCGSVKKSKLIKRVAKLLFQNIRYYMGGRYHAYPATLAYQVLETCVGEPLLRDEVFAQLVKQTTQNPSEDSILMGFKLMYMCLQCFRPGPQLMPVINSHLASASAPVKASYGWRTADEVATQCYTLLADDKLEPTGVCPSMEEIEEITAGHLPSVSLAAAVVK